MYEDTETTHIRAAMTVDEAMELIRHIAAVGGESHTIDIRSMMKHDGGIAVSITVNGGFGITLDGIASRAILKDAVTA